MTSGTIAIDHATGDATGILMPAHADALRADGAAFLTRAFRAFGALGADNAVSRIERVEPCPGGSTGDKQFLTIAYAQPDATLDTELFVKFSRDFNDPVRDARGKYEMASEVRLAEVSRLAAFPITVPTAYFADYEAESHTGLLITRRIPFGESGIEPHRRKCMDHRMADPLGHYRLILRALARIAAADRAGRLSPEVDRAFPFDPQAAMMADAIPHDPAYIARGVADYADFARRLPQLLPAHVRAAAFIARLERDAPRLLAADSVLRRFQHRDPQLIALCHWNANIDNAWFRRHPDGVLDCGLMDWGHVGRMNLAFSIWGSLSAAGLDVWDARDALIAFFLEELAANGGPAIDPRRFRLHLLSYVARMAIGYFLDSPRRILDRLPEVESASGPFDPLFDAHEMPRNQLHILTACMNLWAREDFGAVLDEILALESAGART